MTTQKILLNNRKARAKYEIIDKWEAGIVLTGGEIKSLRAGQASLNEAWIGIWKNEIWLRQAHVTKYRFDTSKNYDPVHDRKLLLHKKEIQRLENKSAEKGLTLIPLKIYEKRGKIKVEIGLGKGLTKYNKRQKIKERDQKLSMERQMKRYI